MSRAREHPSLKHSGLSTYCGHIQAALLIDYLAALLKDRLDWYIEAARTGREKNLLSNIWHVVLRASQ